ncbi:hypothetical protein NM74_04635 [Aeromonas hydrophila]|nr:hypothetical protein NM74_04635 [Aeromonas hydrophila]
MAFRVPVTESTAPRPLLHQAGAAADRVDGLASLLLDAGDGLADLLGGLAGPARQQPHLVGHHGKPAPLLAGPRRLDGGIERQQIDKTEAEQQLA